MKNTRNKIHYARWLSDNKTAGNCACDTSMVGWTKKGVDIFPKQRDQEVTRFRKQVTCKNCKRTKLFRGIK